MSVKFWYDMATLSHRYMEFADTYNKGELAVLANDGTVHQLPRSAAIDLAQFSRVLLEPQDMLDALIAYGLKPNKLVGTTGHIEAMEKHIAYAERITSELLRRRK